MSLQQSELRNRLLRLIPDEDFQHMAPHLHAVDLPKALSLAESNQTIDYYYFIESGLGSIIAGSPEDLKSEVGLVGRDGIIPTAAVLECDTTPHRMVMQVGGYGYRIEAGPLGHILAERSEVRKLFARFVHTLAVQTAYTALSNSVHRVEERLARWILMCMDRSDDGEIALTHEYISIMLAVRRPSVTTALHILEGNRMIYSERGVLTLRDRDALESFARDAYGAPEREYARLIGPMK